MSSLMMYITSLSSSSQPILASAFLKHLFVIDGIGFSRKTSPTGHVCLSVPNILEQPANFGLFVGVCLTRCDHMETWDGKNFPGDNLCGRARLNTTASHFTYSTVSTCVMGTRVEKDECDPDECTQYRLFHLYFLIYALKISFHCFRSTMKSSLTANRCRITYNYTQDRRPEYLNVVLELRRKKKLGNY